MCVCVCCLDWPKIQSTSILLNQICKTWNLFVTWTNVKTKYLFRMDSTPTAIRVVALWSMVQRNLVENLCEQRQAMWISRITITNWKMALVFHSLRTNPQANTWHQLTSSSMLSMVFFFFWKCIEKGSFHISGHFSSDWF